MICRWQDVRCGHQRLQKVGWSGVKFSKRSERELPSLDEADDILVAWI
jgi:hypothetical protein